jgi:hypothetical protein
VPLADVEHARQTQKQAPASPSGPGDQIARPGAEAARDIVSKYLTASLPLHTDDLNEFSGDKHACVDGMIQRTVERMYTEAEENRFLEVTYANGDKEVLYFKDFNSGAMIQNIVDRDKKMAIKASWTASGYHSESRNQGASMLAKRAALRMISLLVILRGSHGWR